MSAALGCRPDMTIKFVCVCGKRLRAREEMASRRSACPRCGRPIGIPSLRPTHREGIAKPLTPTERWARRRSGQPVDARDNPTPRPALSREPASPPPCTVGPVPPPRPLDPTMVRQVAPPTRRANRLLAPTRPQTERRWYEYLSFPVRAGLYVLVVGLVLTGVTGCLVLLLPEVLQMQGDLAQRTIWLLPALFVLVIAAGYAFALLDGALTTGCAGKPAALCWPGWNMRLALHAAGRWLACLLAGPILGLYAALRYWMYCGEPEPLDWLILAEIGGLSLGYWLLLLVAVAQRGRLLDAAPVRVALLLADLGPRALPVVTFAGVVLLAHCLGIFYAIGRLHGHFHAWLILAGCYWSVVFLAVLLCRWLGLWCYRRTIA